VEQKVKFCDFAKLRKDLQQGVSGNSEVEARQELADALVDGRMQVADVQPVFQHQAWLRRSVFSDSTMSEPAKGNVKCSLNVAGVVVESAGSISSL
jgi:hypothetical protein